MFKDLAEQEARLSEKAQEALVKLGIARAAELLGKVAEKGQKIKDPSKHVTAAANLVEKEVEN